MKTIIDKLGALSDEDKSFITSEDAKKYVSMLKTDPEVKEKFEQELQQDDPQYTELLTKIIEFNPFFRGTPAECLKCPIFDEIRVPELE